MANNIHEQIDEWPVLFRVIIFHRRHFLGETGWQLIHQTLSSVSAVFSGWKASFCAFLFQITLFQSRVMLWYDDSFRICKIYLSSKWKKRNQMIFMARTEGHLCVIRHEQNSNKLDDGKFIRFGKTIHITLNYYCNLEELETFNKRTRHQDGNGWYDRVNPRRSVTCKHDVWGH